MSGQPLLLQVYLLLALYIGNPGLVTLVSFTLEFSNKLAVSTTRFVGGRVGTKFMNLA